MTRARCAALLTTAALLTAACAPAQQGSTAGSSAAPASGSSVGSGGLTGQALAFTATTLDGQRLDLSSMSGTPVVLWFWAPWCTICRAEAPDVAAVAAELNGEVTFLGVPGRGPVEDMRSFVQDTGTGGMQHLVDSDGSLWRRFGVVSQPSFVFVDPAGSAELFGGALDGDQLREAASALATG